AVALCCLRCSSLWTRQAQVSVAQIRAYCRSWALMRRIVHHGKQSIQAHHLILQHPKMTPSSHGHPNFMFDCCCCCFCCSDIYTHLYHALTDYHTRQASHYHAHTLSSPRLFP